MNIALFGGSFNPVHNGHIKLIKAIQENSDIQKFIIMPTAVSPHKSNSEMVSDIHRLNMCKLAFEDMGFVEVSDWEIEQKRKSYTYLTIEYLRETYPEDNLFLVIGADMFMCFEKWVNFEVILKKVTLITVPRDDVGYDELCEYEKVLKQYGADCRILKDSVMDVSSSEIRYKIKNDIDISGLLDEKVSDYILKYNLYGCESGE